MVKGVARGTVELRLARGEAAVVGDIGNVLDDAGPGFMVGRVGRRGTHVNVENRGLCIVDSDFQCAGFNRVENFVQDIRDRVVVVEEVVMLSDEAADLPRDLEVVLYNLRNNDLVLVVSSKGQTSQCHNESSDKLFDGGDEESDTGGIPADSANESLLLLPGDTGNE